jgi:hypothetical protein
MPAMAQSFSLGWVPLMAGDLTHRAADAKGR